MATVKTVEYSGMSIGTSIRIEQALTRLVLLDVDALYDAGLGVTLYVPKEEIVQ